MHCILCNVFYASYTIHCILCIFSMHCILYIVFYALYYMHMILCILFFALYSMHCIVCIVFNALYSTHCLLCMYYLKLFANIWQKGSTTITSKNSFHTDRWNIFSLIQQCGILSWSYMHWTYWQQGTCTILNSLQTSDKKGQKQEFLAHRLLQYNLCNVFYFTYCCAIYFMQYIYINASLILIKRNIYYFKLVADIWQKGTTTTTKRN